MAEFVDHVRAEIQALERSLEGDPRYIKLRELQRVCALYEQESGVADSAVRRETKVTLPRKRPAPREMAPATRLVIDAARELMADRSHPTPLRDLYHEIAEVRGIPIGGNEPINNLSAMLYRYGFEAVGRAGWRVRQNTNSASQETNDPEPDLGGLSCAPASNGLASEKHRTAAPLW